MWRWHHFVGDSPELTSEFAAQKSKQKQNHTSCRKILNFIKSVKMSDSYSSFTNGSTQGEPNSEDVMKILLATDNHLGYAEKDSERCKEICLARKF